MHFASNLAKVACKTLAEQFLDAVFGVWNSIVIADGNLEVLACNVLLRQGACKGRAWARACDKDEDTGRQAGRQAGQNKNRAGQNRHPHPSTHPPTDDCCMR